MELNKAKEIAATLMKVGVGKIYLDPKNASKIKEAMTKDDIRGLIADRIIKKRQDNSQSKGRTRKLKVQKQKGRKRGKGKRKGTKKTRTEKKKTWINKVRAQRRTLKEIRAENPDAVAEKGYSNVYKKIKGNYFKGKKYLREYIEGGKQ
ncbi:MAG: 50S ribosomal protein L19e [Candidatus Diapherotrites archaeon]|jgi:large subunit ribosomal protein L19e|uniref:Large ribosomal subunit protein eL19 n=1 Tax=Candidatus Iainarchaeum sp. TaxID=3101447 RepID=A0A8T5GGH9_9ARCH|nr:50S ribosomal protein L19e [Candidatus Diapherotrites archaeon]